jgi:predicted TPR repeat methyltransferase
MKQSGPPEPGPKRPDATRPPRPGLALDGDACAAALNAGLALQQLGRLDHAEAVYKEILRSHPQHFHALQLLATLAGQRKDSAAAVELFDQALRIDPRHALSLYNRAVALQDLKRPAEALESCDRALSIRPDYPQALNQRGIALHELKRADEALLSFDRALSIKPDHGQAHFNRGVALHDLKRFDAALESYDHALSVKPDHLEALYNRGVALLDLNRLDAALRSFDRALTIKPDHVDALVNRGIALLRLKRAPEAIAALRLAIANGGDPEQVGYTLAALGAATVPAATPKRFVTKLFNRFASTFDQHLIGTLKYQTPTLLCKEISQFVLARNLDILDLGCGTGLLGAQLKPLARRLTGVDLSQNMLEMARQLQVYDELICADLTGFLQTQTDQFDLAAAADVFIYIGDLAPVFDGVRHALRAGGVFGFSVEASDAEAFVLQPTLRYAHSVAYLQELAASHQFVCELIEPRTIRQEEGTDVNGFHAILRRS